MNSSYIITVLINEGHHIESVTYGPYTDLDNQYNRLDNIKSLHFNDDIVSASIGPLLTY